MNWLYIGPHLTRALQTYPLHYVKHLLTDLSHWVNIQYLIWYWSTPILLMYHSLPHSTLRTYNGYLQVCHKPKEERLKIGFRPKVFKSVLHIIYGYNVFLFLLKVLPWGLVQETALGFSINKDYYRLGVQVAGVFYAGSLLVTHTLSHMVTHA